MSRLAAVGGLAGSPAPAYPSRTVRTSHKLSAVLCGLLLAGASGCKNKGKNAKSDAPDESAEEDVAGSKGSKLADGPGAAGEGEPGDRTRGRNRNARDLEYLTVDGDRCDRTNKREHQVDVNQDGYADLVTLYTRATEGEKIACKQADLNFDGRLDAFIHYNDSGEVTREQYDQDFDGRIDMGRYYEQGFLVRDEMDLNQDGFADSWRIYDEGRLIRVETDRDADGRADMFTYYMGKQIDRVGYDVNGDGKVDTWDHDAARRARLALDKRRTGDKPEQSDEDAYVDENDGDESDDGADGKSDKGDKGDGKPQKPKAQKPKKSKKSK